MNETQAFQILVIVLSITLMIFLVVAIVATTWLIKVLKHVNTISEKAEGAVETISIKVEQASESIKRNAAPVVAIQTILGLLKRK